jgi:hypothetical protein
VGNKPFESWFYQACPPAWGCRQVFQRPTCGIPLSVHGETTSNKNVVSGLRRHGFELTQIIARFFGAGLAAAVFAKEEAVGLKSDEDILTGPVERRRPETLRCGLTLWSVVLSKRICSRDIRARFETMNRAITGQDIHPRPC